MNTKTILQPPALEIDKRLYPAPDHRPGPNTVLERRIVWNLIHHLQAAGFAVDGVDDYGEFFETPGDPKVALELLANLYHATLLLSKDGKRHGIVFGNGIDVISDWSVPRVSDGFAEAMDAFSPEDYA